MLAEPAKADAGGVVRFETPAGEAVNLALLPFVSQRGIVKADDLMGRQAADHSATYAERLRRLVEHLTEGLDAGDAVNLLAAHAMVSGGTLGAASARPTPSSSTSCPAAAFPASLSYVALGHLHRTQQVPGAACPAWYPGLAAGPGLRRGGATARPSWWSRSRPASPASVRTVPLTAGRAPAHRAGHRR